VISGLGFGDLGFEDAVFGGSLAGLGIARFVKFAGSFY
jgi:hypothetical protein